MPGQRQCRMSWTSEEVAVLLDESLTEHMVRARLRTLRSEGRADDRDETLEKTLIDVYEILDSLSPWQRECAMTDLLRSTRRTRREINTAASRIYFIQSGCTKWIKIGRSRNPEQRLIDLDKEIGRAEVRTKVTKIPPGVGGPLVMLATMPGYAPEERALHVRFHLDRYPDTEWFRLSPALIEYLVTVMVDTSKPYTMAGQ